MLQRTDPYQVAPPPTKTVAAGSTALLLLLLLAVGAAQMTVHRQRQEHGGEEVQVVPDAVEHVAHEIDEIHVQRAVLAPQRRFLQFRYPHWRLQRFWILPQHVTEINVKVRAVFPYHHVFFVAIPHL